jgi:pilus assembly protein Flp/PilA
MMNLLKRLYKDEEGQALVEYGLILSLVAAVVIVALTLLGDNLKALLDHIADEVTTPTT